MGTVEARFLPPQLYPMQSHHMREIEESMPLRSEVGHGKLLDVLRDVQVTFVCFTNRVGSNLLTDLLNQAGFGVRVAQEQFNSSNAVSVTKKLNLRSFDEYLAHVIDEAKRNGTCCLKVGSSQLLWLANRGFVSDFMPSAKYIFVRRRDRIAQAVSLYIMNKTGQYLATITTNEKSQINFDKSEIARELMWILDSEKNFYYFFHLHNICPLELWYEEFVKSSRDTIAEVVRFLSLADASWIDLEAVEVSRANIQRQASEMNTLFCELMRSSFAISQK